MGHQRWSLERARWMGLVGVVGMAGCQLVAGLGDPQPYPADVSCTDNEKNGNETGVDCGGSACGPCGDGDGCLVGTDCTSKVCLPGHTCAAPTCEDMTSNGDETGVDCGGLTCDPCAAGSPCSVNEDCVSGSCANGVCAATCTDMAKNGDESDVDCGGSMCPKCPDDKTCGTGGDCQSGVCQGTCQSNYVWANRYGDQNDQALSAVATDTAGNVLIGGGSFGVVDFGGSPLMSAGGSDAFLTKLDKDGAHQWSKLFGDAGYNQSVASIATDSSQNIILAGFFAGSINFGGQTLTSTGMFSPTSMFLAKLDTDGSHLWSAKFQAGLGTSFDIRARSVAVNAINEIFVVGGFTGSANFGGGTLTTVGDYNAFIASFDQNGGHRWSAHYGDGGEQVATSVAVDQNNNRIVVAGYYDGTITIGNDSHTSASPEGDLFVVQMTADGTPLWTKSVGVNAKNGATAAIDALGNIYLAGQYLSGAADFGAGPIPSSDDVFLAKLDASGAVQWVKTAYDGSPALSFRAPCVTLDADGRAVISGNHWADFSFGGDVLHSGNFNRNVYVAKFDAVGNHLWSRSYGDEAYHQYSIGLVAYGSSTVYVGGIFDGQMDFGGGPLTSLANDVFLARLLTP